MADFPVPIPTGAGNLRYRLAFDQRIQQDDGFGNIVGDWQEQFITAAGMIPMTGGEAARASRLEGIQPYTVSIRNNPQTARITPDWRCRDLRTGQEFAIRTVVTRPTRSYRDLVVVQGEAA